MANRAEIKLAIQAQKMEKAKLEGKAEAARKTINDTLAELGIETTDDLTELGELLNQNLKLLEDEIEQCTLKLEQEYARFEQNKRSIIEGGNQQNSAPGS